MSVIRAVDGQDTGLSAQPAEKKVEEKKKSVKSKSASSTSRPVAVSTNQRFEELDRFNRLEALLLADLGPATTRTNFWYSQGVPAHSPPASVWRRGIYGSENIGSYLMKI